MAADVRQPGLSRNRDLDLDASLDVDDDLLYDLGRSVETVRGLAMANLSAQGCLHLLNQTLVDPHLIRIPRLRALTTRRLAGSDLELLGGETDGAFA